MARTKDFDENEVLKKAVELFWLKGYNGTSMQDLVEGLGISRSSLYDTYGDKHALFVKALENYRCSASAKVNEIMGSSTSSKVAIRNMLEFIIAQLLHDQNNKGCFLINSEVEVAAHDQTVSSMICESDQQIEEAFFEVIKRGQESGEIASKQDPRAMARFTFNTVKGIRVTGKTSNDRAIFDDIIRMSMSVFD
ncbi:transcriptional regulator, TetR family protein [Pedobacter sp. BAL39]|uniref:TetR/AcrR family transcriptional regulator n=1 Tax=Pedobacter sp. BAL39 TaxID=391596 RepID=UPI00015598C8|nr:TetR/AcrR family transcriptional regulator [Pedobacter sp. BAL39]EDM37731.1 transcriptional regulator, TetR family protein [Pedobacter sp. BAL39]